MTSFNPKAFERTILHFDGDSFFASVEQALDYRLKGKPLVTGGERGVITSASIEAKKMGVNRGLTLKEAKEICPKLIILPGDYLSYSLFARSMYSIVKEFVPLVEEYSIDECFADITGLEYRYGRSSEEIALMIKEKLETSLGLTFGVGLGPTKVLAKVASKYRKPGGFTAVTKENYRDFLEHLPVAKIWGIGPSAGLQLGRLGIHTALEFIESREDFLQAQGLSRPCRELRLELLGHSIKPVSEMARTPKSIIKSRTFSPPSDERAFIFSKLSKNIETACISLRRERLKAKEVYFYLKTQNFTYQGFPISLPVPTASPLEIMCWVKIYFNEVYRSKILYRATGVVLRQLLPQTGQLGLFGEDKKRDRSEEVFETVDRLAQKFGEGSVCLGSSLRARKHAGAKPMKRLDLPLLGTAR